MKNIIIDIVLAGMIFRQPKAVNLRSPQRHLTQLQRGQARRKFPFAAWLCRRRDVRRV
ncbi:TPA: hypothetical protein L7504_000579 [Klebsiella pneumoniae]|nr:hypothetical protein [Klebsiella pneumoniae]HBQ5923201.1 hypothetical protein [Klebsiella pneumoniae subsp. pneumoniae]EIX9768886.1 hypothetical protein [Klebsiella pneumoniae]EKU0084704.1 hypothetical protein [Klebsiella pneumoniae]EKU6233304.1 hypothetical protein [Klebsiella pneumoniae]